MHPLQSDPPAWAPLPAAARERGLKRTLLLNEMQARQARIVRLGQRGLIHLSREDLAAFDRDLQAQAANGGQR